MFIYNSLSRKKELLSKPQKSKPLRLFVCGPTVYDDAHIGHARTYIFFDFFVKYLRSLGHKVQYIQNITNIDDKIILRAREEKKDPLKLAEHFRKRYLEDMKSLGIDAIDIYAPATKFIKQITKQVQTLIKKGFAYEIPGDGWYYDVSKFKDYGKLSGRTIAQAEDGVSRIDESIGKRNRADFCLWKYSKPGEPSWKSALGEGRPGWHIEDTAISEYYFGTQYEIHGGGLDLKFPHHEAEIAQQEAASGPPASEFARMRSRAGKKPFVKLWMHTGFLTVHGEKMSKSLGNFVTIGNYLKKHSSAALRLAFLGYHYRSPANYDEKTIKDAEKNIDEISAFAAKLKMAKKSGGSKKIDVSAYAKEFKNSLLDDLNTPGALGSIFKLIGEVNPLIWALDKTSCEAIEKYIKGSLKVLGLTVKFPKVPAKISFLAKKRAKFRVNKQFMQSDALRKKIDSLGYLLEDTPLGPFLWPKN